jgi:probable HAF family extracellular repeat protein
MVMQTSLLKTRKRTLLQPTLPFVLLCATAQAQQFSITDLGSLGGPIAGAFAVNANRLVVGYSALPNASFNAFLWNGTLHDLPPLAGDTQSHAFAVNDLDQITGVSYVLGGLAVHGVLWQGVTPSNLGDFAPRGLNTAGTVVGCVSTAVVGQGWVDRACVLRSGSLMTLPTLGGSFGYAYDLNASEQIVGMSYTAADNARRACLWQNDQPLDLGTLGGANSQAYAINAAGQVVGVSDTSAGTPHAFLYALSSGQVTSRTDLGTLGDSYSYAYALNARGEVVGTSNSRAVYWNAGATVDLNKHIPYDSGWMLTNATAINDTGQIVGLGTYQGWPHAFLLTPAAPDFDHDGDVDQDDFAHLQLCRTKSGAAQDDPACWDALLDGDDSIDNKDVDLFKKCISGPTVPASPDCWR